MTKTTRDMSDRHEEHIAAVLHGRITKGSGNQFRDQMDGKQNHGEEAYVFAWDGKATLAKSVTVTREMWAKAKEQAHWAVPIMPLRFYANTRLTAVEADLAVLDLQVLADLQADANQLARIRESGCLIGAHTAVGTSTCTVCGADMIEFMREVR